MKCNYCGKKLEGKKSNKTGIRSVTLFASGKQTLMFCNPSCMGKAFKKVSRLLKRMSREELQTLVKKINEEAT